MATPQLSPGVLIREVDLTVGRAANVVDNIGAIAGPFEIGPVDEVVQINTQQQYLNTFGQPLSTDRQYEYWMTGGEYLSYGGVLKVVRTDDDDLKNANAGVGIASTTTLKIKNYDDYKTNYETATDFSWAAKTPGRWANNLKVAVIDNLADQTIGIATTNPAGIGATIGFGVTTVLSGLVIPGAGTTSEFNGYLKAIITGVTTDATNSNSSIDVKITARVSSAGTAYPIDYGQNDAGRSFEASDTLVFTGSDGVAVNSSYTAQTVVDWYDQQTLGLTNSTVYWKSLAPKPLTSNYSSSRNGGNDTIHVVVVDDDGSVTGIQGNILEKHLGLSKALDATADGNAPEKSYYKNYVADNSERVYAGYNPSQAADAFHGTSPIAAGFSTAGAWTPRTTAQGIWGVNAQDVVYSSVGSVTYSFGGGENYSSSGGFTATLGNLQTSYNLFSNKDEESVDFLLMGPGLSAETESQAKANLLISIANDRKDCIAVISPHRANVVDVTNTTTQTNNVLGFFAPLTSSSYAVFDAGYKYTYDRFNNEFRYIPTNGDIAGLMVRTDIVAFPWFSPAGQQRGVLNNAIKLAYNPTKAQRDLLYSSRINSIITQRGTGIVLFGDKTGLSYQSAFDRINVRRLFLTVEQALEGAANAQLFELNDSNTRSNFVNIVEPYLRDIQAKRGIYDFLIVCDETNNTPDVIDNNEFRADIYLKPTKSINYITLTFVATRTGVAFEEIVGTV